MDRDTRNLAELLRLSATVGRGFGGGSLLSELIKEYKPPVSQVARYAEAYLTVKALQKTETPAAHFARCLLGQIGKANGLRT